MKRILEKEKEIEEKQGEFEQMKEALAGALAEGVAAGQRELVETMKRGQNSTAKIIKPARPPAWTKNMTLEVYVKALEVWLTQNREIPELVKYQEVIETLKNI